MNSGDGTMRKNRLIWKNWNHKNGNGLHSLQLQILDRGVELLKVGGRIVYSTCSFNPIENEAVVAEMLKLANGSVRLVDVSSELPALQRRPGLDAWKVKAKDGNLYDSFESLPEQLRAVVPESMFAPANAAELNLSHWYAH